MPVNIFAAGPRNLAAQKTVRAYPSRFHMGRALRSGGGKTQLRRVHDPTASLKWDDRDKSLATRFGYIGIGGKSLSRAPSDNKVNDAVAIVCDNLI
jgi:hypothetical protein